MIGCNHLFGVTSLLIHLVWKLAFLPLKHNNRAVDAAAYPIPKCSLFQNIDVFLSAGLNITIVNVLRFEN
jgi:hypothetical protein